MFSNLFIGLSGIIILLYVKDISDIEVSALIRKSELALIIISIVDLLGVALIFAQVWSHYVVCILGLAIILLEFNRRGITTKGVIVSAELSIFGYWDKLHLVGLTQNDRIKLSITRKSILRNEVHYYDSKHYERIVTLLLKYLPKEKIKIREENEEPGAYY